MANKKGGARASVKPAGPSLKPRPSHISLEALDAFLESQAVAVFPDAEPVVPRRSARRAKVPSSPTPTLPLNASLVSPPHSPSQKSPIHKSKEHRIAPQIQITARVGTGTSARSADVYTESTALGTPQKVTTDQRAGQDGSGSRPRRGGTVTEQVLSPPCGDRQVPVPVPPVAFTVPSATEAAPTQSKEKQAAFLDLKERAIAAGSIEDIASTFRALVTLMHDYRKSAPTAACFEALHAIQGRLDAPHEFPRDAESPESYSAILTKAVSVPIQLMSAQLQAQHKALQSLTKSIDSSKTPRPESYATAAAPGPPPQPAPKPVPITSTPDERILLRCDGEAPPTFLRPYRELVAHANSILTPLNLPSITCASRTKDGGVFLVPESKEAVQSLVDAWTRWGPEAFPGARIVPPATYSHIQLDGIVHAAAPDLDVLAKELSDRYPELGPVVGSPTWVNNPPSEAQISATLSAGRKPRTAGSIFVRLVSRDKVDQAVSLGRLRLAGSAPTVSRGFPHLRITQCWGCFKFGHIRARCSVKEAKCAGCGDKAHGTVCANTPHCLNCGGNHRADAFSCPDRKVKVQALRQRAIELTAYLNSVSTVPPPTIPTPAPSRLHESI